MNALPTNDLIFDLGMHNAADTKFYLDKGFRVVALEANPALAGAAQSWLAREYATGQLAVVPCALWNTGGEEISFFLNAEKDDWSSAFRNWAEKGGHSTTEIRVPTITLAELFDQHGVPYYIKCDIEGVDEVFAQQLLHDARRPDFVSVEACSLEVLASLVCAGYDRVQIVNQAFNSYVTPPEPPREGLHVQAQFNGHMSGLFGHELDPVRWTTFSVAAKAYLDFVNLHQRDEKLAHGWLDFHVTTARCLAQRAAA
jgi:FkbM family methyltransferase